MKADRTATLACAVFAMLVAGPVCAQAVPEPDGYRLDAYQAPVPATLQGASALSTDAARTLWTVDGAIFIDVLPHPPKPANLPQGTVWNEKPHQSIRGAVWLPEVGRGGLADETDAYFRQSLATITGGDRDKALTFFCKRSCWMSWNAAKRAQSYGYSHVLWYADGVEGWAEAGLPLTAVEPQS